MAMKRLDVIRRKMNKDELPIVAMTAHALQSELRKCLEAGMNDHVSKPVDPEKLKAALIRWIKPHPGAARAAVESPTASITSIQELPGIDMGTALARMSGNRKLLYKLLRDFALNNTDAIAKIRDAISHQDLPSAQSTVHTLKGVAGNLSMIEVFDISQRLEAAVKQAEESSIGQELDRLDEAMTAVIGAIKNRLPKEDVQVNQDQSTKFLSRPDLDGLGKIMRELDNLLQRHNISARKQFELFKKQIPAGEIQTQLEQLEECMGRLDFKEARKYLASTAQALGVNLAHQGE